MVMRIEECRGAFVSAGPGRVDMNIPFHHGNLMRRAQVAADGAGPLSVIYFSSLAGLSVDVSSVNLYAVANLPWVYKVERPRSQASLFIRGPLSKAERPQ